MDNKPPIEKPDAATPGYHVPVLLQETVGGLVTNPGGVYIDCTYGGGGHARELLRRLNGDAKLLAFDQDADASQNIPDDNRILFVPSNFKHLRRFMRLHKLPPADGIMADLGVSSHQFDEPERGFSTRFDAPMDMRMDRRQSLTAFEVLNTYSEQQLHALFEQYGEVTNSKTLAKTITTVRTTTPLKTISNFKAAVHGVVKGNPNKYFAQVFQALRIEVNDELGVLRELLGQLPEALKPGGRAAIITFHSLEDRLVKLFFRNGTLTPQEENPFDNTRPQRLFNIITPKPVTASPEELKLNPRSRSAKLRIAERLEETTRHQQTN